eukprot:scaffold84982_cov20-Tisochrysis_lutea.AAC.1
MPHGLSDMHGGSMYGDEHGMDEDEDDDYDEEMPEDDEDEEQACEKGRCLFTMKMRSMRLGMLMHGMMSGTLGFALRLCKRCGTFSSRAPLLRLFWHKRPR